MAKTDRVALLIFLVSSLGAAGYAYHRGQVRQTAALERISALEGHLAINNQQRAQTAAATVRSIAHYACDNRNPANDLAVLKYSEQILARTQTLVDTLHLVRQQLQRPDGPADLADQLPAQLNRYCAFLNQAQIWVPLLTQPSAETAASGWFGQFALQAGPRAAARAALTKLEAQLRRYEAQALRKQAERVGSRCIRFDPIRPLAVPISKTVTPGAEYQARLFLVQFGYGGYCNVRMTANGAALTEPGDQGMPVVIAVPPAQPGQPDTLRAQWHGRIQTQVYPGDTVLQVAVPYLIVKHPTP